MTYSYLFCNTLIIALIGRTTCQCLCWEFNGQCRDQYPVINIREKEEEEEEEEEQEQEKEEEEERTR